jgi:hypothetical protein
MMLIIVLTRLCYTLLFNEFTIYKFTFLSVIVQLVYDVFYYIIKYYLKLIKKKYPNSILIKPKN